MPSLSSEQVLRTPMDTLPYGGFYALTYFCQYQQVQHNKVIISSSKGAIIVMLSPE